MFLRCDSHPLSPNALCSNVCGFGFYLIVVLYQKHCLVAVQRISNIMGGSWCEVTLLCRGDVSTDVKSPGAVGKASVKVQQQRNQAETEILKCQQAVALLSKDSLIDGATVKVITAGMGKLESHLSPARMQSLLESNDDIGMDLIAKLQCTKKQAMLAEKITVALTDSKASSSSFEAALMSAHQGGLTLAPKLFTKMFKRKFVELMDKGKGLEALACIVLTDSSQELRPGSPSWLMSQHMLSAGELELFQVETVESVIKNMLREAPMAPESENFVIPEEFSSFLEVVVESKVLPVDSDTAKQLGVLQELVKGAMAVEISGDNLKLLNDARVAAGDLSKSLFKPLNILPLGVKLLEHIDERIVVMKADSEGSKAWREVCSKIVAMEAVSIQALSLPNGYSHSGPLMVWFASITDYERIVTTVSKQFRDSHSDEVAGSDAKFTEMRLRICEHHRQMYHAAIASSLTTMCTIISEFQEGSAAVTLEKEQSLVASALGALDGALVLVANAEAVGPAAALGKLGTSADVCKTFFEFLNGCTNTIGDFKFGFPCWCWPCPSRPSGRRRTPTLARCCLRMPML
jgi:hypothetical protein